MESLIGIGRSESFADLNNPDFARNLLGSSSNLYTSSGEKSSSTWETFTPNNQSTGNTRGRHSFSGKSSAEDPLNATANGGKPFGISELHNFHLLIFPTSFSFLHTKKLNTESFPQKRVFRLDLFFLY
jgi:hypothetical protein